MVFDIFICSMLKINIAAFFYDSTILKTVLITHVWGYVIYIFDPENTNRMPPMTLKPLQASECWCMYDMWIFFLNSDESAQWYSGKKATNTWGEEIF